MNNNTPCKDCLPPIRHVGCHSECEKYISWKQQHDKQMKINRENKAKMNAADGHVIELLRKWQRKQQQR